MNDKRYGVTFNLVTGYVYIAGNTLDEANELARMIDSQKPFFVTEKRISDWEGGATPATHRINPLMVTHVTIKEYLPF